MVVNMPIKKCVALKDRGKIRLRFQNDKALSQARLARVSWKGTCRKRRFLFNAAHVIHFFGTTRYDRSIIKSKTTDNYVANPTSPRHGPRWMDTAESTAVDH